MRGKGFRAKRGVSRNARRGKRRRGRSRRIRGYGNSRGGIRLPS